MRPLSARHFLSFDAVTAELCHYDLFDHYRSVGLFGSGNFHLQ
jgi:hypothetical protein